MFLCIGSIMEIGLELINIKTRKKFTKYFDTEYQRQCFIRKSKYFKNIIVIEKEKYNEKRNRK